MSESKTILIVEDSAVQRVMLQRLLQKAGYRYVSAKDGLEGLALLRQQRPSLVISDVSMPNMDGYEMCQTIKQDPELWHIPVLLLTTLEDTKEIIRSLEVGADNYLIKPADDHYLLERIHYFLTLSEEERGPGDTGGVMVSFAGERYQIRAGRRQTMSLLLSTYEHAVRKNRELLKIQAVNREKDALLIKTIKDGSRAKSDFIANLSHEVRTPMNAIIGLANLGLRSNPEAKVRDYLEKIDKSSQSLMGCLNDILDFSKIEAGKLELYPEQFNPHDLFNNLSDMFADQAANKALELIFSIPSDYFEGLFGDAKRLQQIFVNLLRNAIKFTEQGSIVVKAHPNKIKTGLVELEFSVQDTGIGIHAEQIKKLFVPFAQADPAIAIKYGGTGLGLNICNQLVNMMGGRIWVESTLGQGSLFHFTVKLQCKVATCVNMVVPSHLQNIRILVVDDHAMTRDIMRGMLDSFNFAVKDVDSGEAALESILETRSREKTFDLVLMDWRMPGMDGIETVAAIRSKLARSLSEHIMPKVILVTAFGKSTVKKYAQISGVDLLLHKPVTREQLFNAILGVFGSHAPQQDQSRDICFEESVTAEKVSGARVLLAEDNSINQQVAKELLERVGVLVKIAENGEEALHMMEEGSFDLVLMDLQMPEMDGYEATIQIRNNPRLAHVPIVAMTAHVLESAREKSFDVGMNDHITKPIHIHQLYSTLIRWINPEGIDSRFGRVMPAQFPAFQDDYVLPPVLEGIDLNVVAQRFGQQHAHFKKMLLGLGHYSTFADDIRQALRWQDWLSVENMVHIMKGVAGNLCATSLYQVSSAMEKALAEGWGEQHDALLEQFDEALYRVLKSVRLLEREQKKSELQKEESTGGARGTSDMAALLKKFSDHLQARDTDAELSLSALKHVLGENSYQEELQQIEARVFQFDYPGALTYLKELERSLKSVNGGDLP